jgi:hypothetical protein
MDELGSRIQHAGPGNATVALAPFFFSTTGMAYSILWPLKYLDEGEEVTRLGVDKFFLCLRTPFPVLRSGEEWRGEDLITSYHIPASEIFYLVLVQVQFEMLEFVPGGNLMRTFWEKSKKQTVYMYRS